MPAAMPDLIMQGFITAVEHCLPATDEGAPAQYEHEDTLPIEQCGDRFFFCDFKGSGDDEEMNTAGKTQRAADVDVVVVRMDGSAAATTFGTVLWKEIQTIQQVVVRRFATTGFCPGVLNVCTRGPGVPSKTLEPRKILVRIPFHVEYEDDVITDDDITS